MRLADPELLVLLLALPIFAWSLRREWRRRDRALHLPTFALLAPPPGEPEPRPSRRLRTLPYLPALRLIGILLIVLALARPQTSDAETIAPAEGIDIVLAIDASGSMVQNLLGDETRIDAARRVARDFVAARDQDRVGLVIFQAETLVLSPLTLDLDAIDTLIDESVVNDLLPDGTAVGLALAESIDLLRTSSAPSRAVVLLTDGEDNVRTVRPVQAAAIAQALGVRIYTIGIIRGDAIQGVVDEVALRFIAATTDGQYFRAEEITDLENAYAEIDALERARVGAERFTSYRELAPWLLVPGLLLILLELLAHATWWRRAP